LPDQTAQGSGTVIYHCTENTTASSLSAQVDTTATETLNFSNTGGGSGRIGLSAIVVAEGSFGLSATNGTNSSVSSTVTARYIRENVPDCEGAGVESEYTRFNRTGSIREYSTVEEYLCDCVSFGGYILEYALVVYYCQPRLVQANSSLVRSNAGTWLRVASFNPPTAPSAHSTSRCDYCDDDDNDDDDPTGPCGYSDDLDPYGDEDGDGIKNRMDPTPNGEDHDLDIDFLKTFLTPDDIGWRLDLLLSY